MNTTAKNREVCNEDDDENSVESTDTLHDYIGFQSNCNEIGLEESISFTYPKIDSRKLTLSTLLKERDLVPLFDGAGWAGTKLWPAAIWGIKYIVDHYGLNKVNKKGDGAVSASMSLCELGCGLGLPGMISHMYGFDVLLTDQEIIMSQLSENVEANFPETFKGCWHDNSCLSSANDDSPNPSIQIYPFAWSRQGLHNLLSKTGYQNFDIVLNCDCVYEPLYGKSWESLVEVIDECLKLNPQCVVFTSVERRRQGQVDDGIDRFVDRMRKCKSVCSVEMVLEDEQLQLQLYVTKGSARST